MSGAADLERLLPIEGAYDLRGSFVLHPPSDPCILKEPARYGRATHTPDGPATWCIEVVQGQLRFQAWGPGAAWCAERAEDFSGLWDSGHDWQPEHPVLRGLARQRPGLRFPKMHRVYEALVPYVLGQLVQDVEKARAWRLMCAALGTPAPGPLGLQLPPTAKALYRCSQARMKRWGVLGFQARTLKELSFVASRLEKATAMPYAQAVGLLTKVRGIGPWTVGMAGIHSLGHPDAVPEKDYNLPRMVGHVLNGDADSLDEAGAMASLAPFRPNRGRALMLMWTVAPSAPRRHHRAPLRDLKA